MPANWYTDRRTLATRAERQEKTEDGGKTGQTKTTEIRRKRSETDGKLLFP